MVLLGFRASLGFEVWGFLSFSLVIEMGNRPECKNHVHYIQNGSITTNLVKAWLACPVIDQKSWRNHRFKILIGP